MIVLRHSDWRFHTSAGADIGIANLMLSRGMFALDDPAGASWQFGYAGSGIGFGFPIAKYFRKLGLPPVYLNGQQIAGTGSTTDFPSFGGVYATPFTKGRDLTLADFEGGAAYVELGAGMVVGGGAALFFLGINRYVLQAAASFPQFIGKALETSSAVIYTYGVNEGLVDSVSGGLLFGEVTSQGAYDGH